MDELRRLGLISRLARTLAPYAHVCDRDLAEYVLNLYDKDTAGLKGELADLGDQAFSQVDQDILK